MFEASFVLLTFFVREKVLPHIPAYGTVVSELWYPSSRTDGRNRRFEISWFLLIWYYAQLEWFFFFFLVFRIYVCSLLTLLFCFDLGAEEFPKAYCRRGGDGRSRNFWNGGGQWSWNSWGILQFFNFDSPPPPVLDFLRFFLMILRQSHGKVQIFVWNTLKEGYCPCKSLC